MEKIIMNDIEINPCRREVIRKGESVFLTTMEFDVLIFLASNPNIAFTKEQIYEAAARDNYVDTAYVIKDIVYRIRKKTGIKNIQTIYGYGYKFVP